jgi:ubiquinone/menaquinone biosynthesis C-methylase UbiE
LARERFSRKSLADQYPTEYGNRWRDRREEICIRQCLRAIPSGSRVLDLPCGAGRMTRILVQSGYRVTGADVSDAMLARARENYREFRNSHPDAPPVQFTIRDILSTCFEDNEFDGVSCIRLFHHFADSLTRQQALCELRRICRGPIVVTFLNSFALDRVTYWVRDVLRGKKRVAQLPISYKTFKLDIEAAGLQINKTIAAHWGVSSRWFLVLSRRPT